MKDSKVTVGIRTYSGERQKDLSQQPKPIFHGRPIFSTVNNEQKRNKFT
jgi:hypothetical protein